jgi:F0F1-type ATP synthase delta subunit
MADHSTLARPYAKALFDLARSSGKLAAWSEALNAAAAVLADPNAKRVLASPSLDDSKRAGFIRAMSVGLKSADVFETAGAHQALGPRSGAHARGRRCSDRRRDHSR